MQLWKTEISVNPKFPGTFGLVMFGKQLGLEL